MAEEMTCPICEAEIPLEGDEESGDFLMCSYCKVTFKMLRKKDKWILVEDFEEQLHSNGMEIPNSKIQINHNYQMLKLPEPLMICISQLKLDIDRLGILWSLK